MTNDHNSEPLTIFTVPKYNCGTHGKHEHWVAFMKTGEPTVMYCLQCVRDFLDRQSIGKVTLP